MAEDRGQQDGTMPEPSSGRGAAGGSLRGTFPGQFRPTSEEFDRLWEVGMFVVDTNVLLNLYRYSRSTRDELLEVLRALGGKLFLPHQVGREFLDRRLTTIRKQREGFAALRGRVTGVREEVEKELRKVLRLRPGEGLPGGLKDALEEVPPGGYAKLAERLEELENGLPRASNSPEVDEAWAAVVDLFEGRVGPPYLGKALEEALEEAARRKEAKVPPGFKDERPGDYLLWRQTIDEAKRSGRPVVLATDDRKDDWWWIEQGETLGPQPALVAEMREEAGVPFYMYTPDRLMQQARERLGVKVSDESISEAEGLGLEAGDAAADAAEALNARERYLFPTLYPLTDEERIAMRAYLLQDRGLNGVVEDLSVSRPKAARILERAHGKMWPDADASDLLPWVRREVSPKSTRRYFWQGEPDAEGNPRRAEAQPIRPTDARFIARKVKSLLPESTYLRLVHGGGADLAASLTDRGYDRSLTRAPLDVIFDAVASLPLVEDAEDR